MNKAVCNANTSHHTTHDHVSDTGIEFSHFFCRAVCAMQNTCMYSSLKFCLAVILLRKTNFAEHFAKHFAMQNLCLHSKSTASVKFCHWSFFKFTVMSCVK